MTNKMTILTKMGNINHQVAKIRSRFYYSILLGRMSLLSGNQYTYFFKQEEM